MTNERSLDAGDEYLPRHAESGIYTLLADIMACLEELNDLFDGDSLAGDSDAEMLQTRVEKRRIDDFLADIRMWTVDARVDDGSLDCLQSVPLREKIWSALNDIKIGSRQIMDRRKDETLTPASTPLVDERPTLTFNDGRSVFAPEAERRAQVFTPVRDARPTSVRGNESSTSAVKDESPASALKAERSSAFEDERLTSAFKAEEQSQALKSKRVTPAHKSLRDQRPASALEAMRLASVFETERLTSAFKAEKQSQALKDERLATAHTPLRDQRPTSALKAERLTAAFKAEKQSQALRDERAIPGHTPLRDQWSASALEDQRPILPVVDYSALWDLRGPSGHSDFWSQIRYSDNSEVWIYLRDAYQSLRATVKAIRLAHASTHGKGPYADLRGRARGVAEGRGHATGMGRERSYQFDTSPQSQMERITKWDFDFGRNFRILSNWPLTMLMSTNDKDDLGSVDAESTSGKRSSPGPI